MKIYIVGDGAGIGSLEELQQSRQDASFSLNTAQGRSIWIASKIAFDNSKLFQEKFKGIFELVPKDDKANIEESINISKQILTDHTTLAVIGHSTSATSLKSAIIYAQGNIPLIMPIATSPNVGFDITKKLPNTFRLPANDLRGQAPAVFDYVYNIIKPNSILIICDKSKDASDYSIPLSKSLDGYFKSYKVIVKMMDYQPNAFTDIPTISQRYDIIIFVGYGTNANDLILKLDNHYANNNQLIRPLLFLTDGCKQDDLLLTHFETYLSFPLPSLENINEVQSNNSLKQLKDGIDKHEEAYHLFGYDAIIILETIINNLHQSKKPINRSSIVHELNSLTNISSVFDYSFKNGENINANYYIYSNKIEGEIKNELRMIHKMEATRLNSIYENYN